MTTLNDSMKSLMGIAHEQADAKSKAAGLLLREAHEAKTFLTSLPNGEINLAAMMLELAEAEEECSKHHTRFPSTFGPNKDEQENPRLASEAWMILYNRREAAARNISRLAVLMRRFG